MTEQQIPKVVASLVEHQTAFSVLPNDDAQWVITNTKDAIAIACQAIRNRVKVVAKKAINLLHLPPITSDGRNGYQFIEVMEANGYNLGDWAKNVMTVGKDANGNLILTSTSGVTYKPVVIKGDEFTDVERNTANIRKVAVRLKLVTPPWWLAPLLREAMSDEEIEKLGFDWLIVMHDAITDSDGDLLLLGLDRLGSRELNAYFGSPSSTGNRQHGFVFLAPQE